MASLMSILQQAGFTGEGLRMAYAIAMAESGGNRLAHNTNAGTGDNSYGLFQINMLGAMGPERVRQYGLGSYDDLFDPLTNARVAYKMSHGGTSWGPWTTYTTGAYKAYYGGGGAEVAGVSGVGGSGGTTPVTPKLDAKELAEEYGLSSALINSNKELKALFNKAVAGQWSATRFQASLKNTKWWSTQSDSLRKYVTLKYTDPATYNQNFGNAEAKINALAVQVGLGTQFANGKGSKILQEATYNSLALGWSDARIKDWLGTRVQMHDGGMWGEAGETFDKLHELAYLNGLRYGGTWMQEAARQVASGRTTIQDFENRIRTTAAARYSAYADQIRAGQNVMDLAAPYIKSTASILELNEADVDLFNSHVAKAMTATPAKGGAAGSQMPLWQYENELRQDPLWRKTNNAREGLMTVAHQVAKDFGMAF